MSNLQPPSARSRTTFKVRIDRHGAVLIDCHAGSDHVETGIRGLAGLVQRGWMARRSMVCDCQWSSDWINGTIAALRMKSPLDGTFPKYSSSGRLG